MRERERFSPAQCRAGRALLEWTAEDLSTRAALDPEAVELFEAQGGDLAGTEQARIGSAFYAAGVIAIPEGLAGEGVRFSRPAVARTAFAQPYEPDEPDAPAFARAGRR
jgi:hypothetical protein